MGLGLTDGTYTGTNDPSAGYNGDCSPKTGHPDCRRWLSGALGDDGKIYCPPFNSNKVLVIDTNTTSATATLKDFGLNFSDSYKFRGAIKAPNGKIYCVPYDSTDILIIDPATQTAVRSNLGASIPSYNASDSTTWDMWMGGVLANNGKIYCIPCNASRVLVIDTNNDTAYLDDMGVNLDSTEQYYDGALGVDGKIYCMPNLSQDILIIDPSNDTAIRTNMGLDLTYPYSNHKFAGAVIKDNKIYGIPL